MLQNKANSAVWGPYFGSYSCLVCGGWGRKKNPHKGQNRLGTFSHFSAIFHTFSHFFSEFFRIFPPGLFLRIKGFTAVLVQR